LKTFGEGAIRDKLARSRTDAAKFIHVNCQNYFLGKINVFPIIPSLMNSELAPINL
jgi:hypothetical protein